MGNCEIGQFWVNSDHFGDRICMRVRVRLVRKLGTLISMKASVEDFSPRIGRIPVRTLGPLIEAGRWPAKGFQHEVIPFRAEAFREGHDLIGVRLHLTSPQGRTSIVPAKQGGNSTDTWQALAQVTAQGQWRFEFEAFADDFATWRHAAEIKVPAGIDTDVMLELGIELFERATANTTRSKAQRATIAKAAKQLTDSSLSAADRLASALSTPLIATLTSHPITSLNTFTDAETINVERTRAGVGSWYEFFPRSIGAHRFKNDKWRSGTFRSAVKDLPRVAGMGFDVLYLPPIHPIGETNRKGRNNTLVAEPGDPGSPWAIGSASGGHDAIHPDLGKPADFRAFVRQANALGIEVALDLALQASPDHPWVTEHPEWFTTLPDGSIAFAENPPKKYQDIYPINFDNDPDGLYQEVLRIVRHWISQGVQIFRVDNPHTKPTRFWEWLIHTVNDEFPDVIFLAEAFTRPAPMGALGKVGFQQSYTYFTWRNTAEEVASYLSELAHDSADYVRPNLFVNTPDILTEYLQYGGPAAFAVRAAIAATGAPTWGMYSGFELFEHVARDGAEEYIDNEKYEYKQRDFEAAEQNRASLAPFIARLNQIRRENPALQQLRNLTVHRSDDERIVVYSKHLAKEFNGAGETNTVIVVANTSPQYTTETTVHLDLAALGLPTDAEFTVDDLVTGDTWQWSAHNYVRLGGGAEPVHILRVHTA